MPAFKSGDIVPESPVFGCSEYAGFHLKSFLPPILFPNFLPPTHIHTSGAPWEPPIFNLNPFPSQSPTQTKTSLEIPLNHFPSLHSIFYLPSSACYLPFPKVESNLESALDFSLFPAILKKPQTLINTKDSRQLTGQFVTFLT